MKDFQVEDYLVPTSLISTVSELQITNLGSKYLYRVFFFIFYSVLPKKSRKITHLLVAINKLQFQLCQLIEFAVIELIVGSTGKRKGCSKLQQIISQIC